MRVFEYFKALFRSRLVAATTAIFSVAYYLLIEYLISLNATNGLIFITVPQIFVYALAFSSAILLSISIHTIKFSLSRLQTEVDGIASLLTVVFGAVIAGCNCELPILASIMYLLTLNVVEVSSVLSFISSYQIELFSLLILLNILISYHHLSRLSGSCTIKRGRLVRLKK
ncbi:MAG: hypothetical protein KGH65_03160 [Candidatus Micrarchaeota archaeon]|nr:hypothetical protein [Candidatus Micrarchaeota archaeon]